MVSIAEFDFIQNLPSLTSLSLQGLHGKVSDKILRLPHLFELELSSNKISSAVLDFIIENLSSLTSLHLVDCELHGIFSDKILRLPRLSELDLSYSDISSAGLNFIGNLSSLKSLSLLDYGLDGRYLDKILMLLCLAELDLSSKNFSSIKPHFFGNISSSKSLTQLVLYNCTMSGPLPTQLGNFTRLELLDLSGNQMDGEIPMWIWNVGNGSLYHNLSHNALQALQNPNPNLSLISLEYLDLSSNVLEGLLPIPSSLLRFYSVSSNNPNGEIPMSICNLTPLKLFDVSDNNLSALVPQCVGEMSNVLAVLHLQGNALLMVACLEHLNRIVHLRQLILAEIRLKANHFPYPIVRG